MEQKEEQSQSMRRVLFASVIGTAMEWYDYVIFGTAAALVFNKLFFPAMDPLTGVIAAFGTYGVGAIARPVGSAIFGHFGDRTGRKAMLMVTMFIMGGATFLIGLLPTYEQIGIWAAILLVALRLLQGIGIGGEWGAASLIVLEHAPQHRRGLYGSLVQLGAPIGIVMSMVAFVLVSRLTEENLISWGWRLPFLFSIVLLVLGMYIRVKLEESPIFRRAKARNDISRTPVIEMIKTHPRTFFIAVGMKMGESTLIFVVSLFSMFYVTSQLGLSRTQILDSTLIAAVVALFIYPAFGALSDWIGRRPFFIVAPVLMVAFAFLFFWMLDTKNPYIITLSIILGFSIIHPMVFALQSTYFPELFKTRVRFSGASIGFQFGAAIAGGISPIVATSLFKWSGGTEAVSIYLAAMALISLGAALAVRETLNIDLEDASQYESGKRGIAPDSAKAQLVERA